MSNEMTKDEKSIRYIGTYFLILGLICSCLAPLYFSSIGLVCPICIALMCLPRLLDKGKKEWSNVLLMTCAILTSLVLFCVDGVFTILLCSFDQMDFSANIFIIIITTIALLNFYLCCRLFILLF